MTMITLKGYNFWINHKLHKYPVEKRTAGFKLICIFLILTFHILGCTNKNIAREKSKQEELNSIEDKIMSFNLAGFTETGRKKWEVEGESANILEDLVGLTNIVARAYGDETTVTLTADEGTFNRINNNVHLQKNVVAITTEGTRLTTDSLDWENSSQSVSTDKLVKIEKENLEAVGKGGVGKPQLKQVELKTDVTVRVKPNTVITCEGPLEVDYENDIAIFNNDVKVADIKGEIYADKVTVYFEPKTRKIERAIAVGNVKIVRGNNFTFSQKAEYLALRGKVILTGKPYIELYPKGTGPNVSVRN